MNLPMSGMNCCFRYLTTEFLPSFRNGVSELLRFWTKNYDRITKCVDVKGEMGYAKKAEEMTIVVTLLLFLYKFDDSRIFYRNIFAKQ